MSSVDAPQSSETKENVISAKTRKSSFFLNPTADASNELIQLLLNELKEMRMEMKEMKEDVSVMKTEQDNQKESLKEIGEIQKYHQESIIMVHSKQRNQKEDLSRITENMGDIRENQQKLQEDVSVMKAEQDIQKEVLKEMTKEMKENKKSLEEIEETRKKLQEDVTQNQQDQEQSLQELKDDVSLKLEKIEKELEYKRQWDIRKRIFGKWRDVQSENSYIRINFENDTIMITRLSSDVIKLGVEDEYGYTTFIENNKIVRSNFSSERKDFWRYEYYIENETLIHARYFNGIERKKDIYMRVGDYDSE